MKNITIKELETLYYNPDFQDKAKASELLTAEEQKVISSFFERSSGWVQTYTGKKFFPLQPNVEAIDLEDIAHALSMSCRFTGHTKFHYSIAQHSVLVSYLAGAEHAFAGLLHDASEAYLSDISSPIKRSSVFVEYKEIEKVLQSAIYTKFGLPVDEHPSVKKADVTALCIEANSLFNQKHKDWVMPTSFPSVTIQKLTPEEAKEQFLKRFNELTHG